MLEYIIHSFIPALSPKMSKANVKNINIKNINNTKP